MNNKPQSEYGIAAMILGIISVVFSIAFFPSTIGGITGIIGLILANIGFIQKSKKTGMAIIGLILNLISVFILFVTIFAYLMWRKH